MESSQKIQGKKKPTWVEWTSEMNQTFDEGACAGPKAKKFFNRNLKSDLPITLELGSNLRSSSNLLVSKERHSDGV